MFCCNAHLSIGPAHADLLHKGNCDLARKPRWTQSGKLKGEKPLGSRIIETVESSQDLLGRLHGVGDKDRRGYSTTRIAEG